MPSIEIKKVESLRDLKTFVDFQYDLYKGNEYNVPNLFTDDLNTLRKDKNPAFDFCEAEYYLAYKNGKLAGRVAAIINHHANDKWERQSVRFGWIDFIDDIEVSTALLKQVEDYGRSKGMTEVLGPLGFTDMDPEGMLTWGFDKLSTIATIYNYPYYPEHMKKMGGWEIDQNYVEYLLDVPKEIPEKYAKVAEIVEKRYNLHVRKMTRKDVTKRNYGQMVFSIINQTYGDLYGYSELTDKQIDHYVNMYLRFADLSMITLIEDWNKDRKLIGIGISVPSLSRALQKCHRGRLFPFGWWYLLMAIKFHKTRGGDLLLMGILPEYRSKGANALLFTDLIPVFNKYGFTWAESQVELETNGGVQSQWGPLQPTNHKRRSCFKKEIVQ
ncbi:MAG: N-acetyltransferase [Prevotella sp.]